MTRVDSSAEETLYCTTRRTGKYLFRVLVYAFVQLVHLLDRNKDTSETYEYFVIF